ncbi:dihydrolipoyl dehydrogenase [Elusimicrobiota bacterium]
MNKYDVIIIGGGPAGYRAAEKLSEFKRSVCIIETSANHIGGTCLNSGCIPIKSFVESSDLVEKIKNSPSFGINAELKLLCVRSIKESMRDNIYILKKGLLSLLNSKKIEILYGKASFISEKSVKVELEKGGTEELEAYFFIIATGSRPGELPDIKCDGKQILNSNQFLKSDLDNWKKDILIAGGGYIGCELASILNKLEFKVTVVELLDRILPGEDAEISRTLQREFKKKGISVITGSRISKASKKKSGIKTVIRSEESNDEKVLQFDRIIVCAGRVPFTSGLDLEKAGLNTENGFVPVNQNMQTKAENIYAAGDVIDSPMLAHTAYREALLAAESIAGQSQSVINYNIVPRIVFSSPQIGCIGSSEEKAAENGIEIMTRKRFFKANAKAVIRNEEAGFAKIICNKKSGEIIGACVIGPEASELIHILSHAVLNKLNIREMDNIVFGHPTLSEIFI